MVDLNIRERVRRAAGRGGGSGDDEQIDQLEARLERARQEAEREGKREARRERVQQTREEARERAREEAFTEDEQPAGALGRISSAIGNAVDAVDDGDGESLDDVRAAMQTDFDDDGEPFAAEIGLESNAEATQHQQVTGTLANQVNENTASIDFLEAEVSESSGGRGGAGGVFDGGMGAEDPWGLDDDGGSTEADEFWGL
jgi:hypothetical protein